MRPDETVWYHPELNEIIITRIIEGSLIVWESEYGSMFYALAKVHAEGWQEIGVV